MAGAVTLSPHGIGQALIYPYYTVNKHQDTLLSVTNASDVGKAIQVRFREGRNGRDALSFVLLLGAHDTWTAALSSFSDEAALLKTSDASCTLPTIPPDGVSLRSAGYDGTGSAPADGGPRDLSRTREGFFEFIVGGDVIAGSATDRAMAHSAGAAPACPEDNQTFVHDLGDPTKSGIFGSASIVDVADGTFFPYNADALMGIADDVMFVDGNPYPGPQLSDAMNAEGVEGVARAYVTATDGRGLTLDYASGIDAVSAVYAADAIYNEYLIADSLGAKTDWVVTFPTKQFYVDPLYGDDMPHAPFDNAFVAGQAPVEVTGTVFNREGVRFDFGSGCGELLCQPAALPFQVNVLPIGAETPFDVPPVGLLGSTLDVVFVPAIDDAGHAIIRLSTGDGRRALPGGIDLQHGEQVVLRGLPVTGFMVYNVVNANAVPSVLANYSGAFPHRRTVDCDGGNFGCPVHLDH